MQRSSTCAASLEMVQKGSGGNWPLRNLGKEYETYNHQSPLTMQPLITRYASPEPLQPYGGGSPTVTCLENFIVPRSRSCISSAPSRSI